MAVYRRGLQWLDHLAESRVASGKKQGASLLRLIVKARTQIVSSEHPSPHWLFGPKESDAASLQ